MIPFTDTEKQTIARLSVPGGWDHEDAGPLKAKLKPYLLARTTNCCCYCRRSLHQWHGLTIDIEHVLPKAKGKFPELMFEPNNLSVACKRCNMGIKREGMSFYLAPLAEANLFRSAHYSFIHPNFDVADNHLRFLSIQYNGKLMVKYQVVNGSEKGVNAYAYFKLKNLEINSFDEAQGLEDIEPSDSLPPELANELQKVLDSIAQTN